MHYIHQMQSKMQKKSIFTLFATLCSINFLTAQFIVKDQYFETTGVSNEGLVAGYEAWAGPYLIWTPETQAVENIGGVAPGQGVGGQARFSADGNYLSGTTIGFDGPEMSRYNRSTNEWIPSGSLGFSIDGTVSGGYAISGDGKSVVGNAWADTTGGTAYTHAVAWVEAEGLVDLGSLYDDMGRSARVNAVSSDGSVVVGWQDFNGPWKSAVWRKNPAGGYFPNEYLLINPNGNAADEYNQLGECTAVSADGEWIGGYGDYANNGEPWMWSQATGLVNLGTLADGAQGYVAGINANGTVAVGRFQNGPWEPELPFIWTATGGLQNLNDYIKNTLGLDTGSKQVYSANCMSENGQYLAGYGVDTITLEYFAYRVSLFPSVATNEAKEVDSLNPYPNPTADYVTIQNPDKASLTIRNVDGKVVYKKVIEGNQTLDVSTYPSGLYFLSLQAEDMAYIKTGKLVKRP